MNGILRYMVIIYTNGIRCRIRCRISFVQKTVYPYRVSIRFVYGAFFTGVVLAPRGFAVTQIRRPSSDFQGQPYGLLVLNL